ncbi:MAG: hypothetical protein HYV09_28880 [Deltaproteobacteria bacterium]|nr:hypothetical protein [Deltaproteobacteria bacterium]
MSLRRRIARTLRRKDEAARAPVPPISVTLFEFATPMTDTMPVPRKLAHLKAAMALAQLAWNLPILERSGDPALAKEYRAMAEAELATKPALARELVAQMMKSRLTRYARDERLVTFVDVVEDGAELRILATDSHVREGL